MRRCSTILPRTVAHAGSHPVLLPIRLPVAVPDFDADRRASLPNPSAAPLPSAPSHLSASVPSGAGGTCVDTTGWTNNKVPPWTCDLYASNGACANGNFVVGMEWTGKVEGPGKNGTDCVPYVTCATVYNNPAANCCACGKPSGTPTHPLSEHRLSPLAWLTCAVTPAPTMPVPTTLSPTTLSPTPAPTPFPMPRSDATRYASL